MNGINRISSGQAQSASHQRNGQAQSASHQGTRQAQSASHASNTRPGPPSGPGQHQSRFRSTQAPSDEEIRRERREAREAVLDITHSIHNTSTPRNSNTSRSAQPRQLAPGMNQEGSNSSARGGENGGNGYNSRRNGADREHNNSVHNDSEVVFNPQARSNDQQQQQQSDSEEVVRLRQQLAQAQQQIQEERTRYQSIIDSTTASAARATPAVSQPMNPITPGGPTSSTMRFITPGIAPAATNDPALSPIQSRSTDHDIELYNRVMNRTERGDPNPFASTDEESNNPLYVSQEHPVIDDQVTPVLVSMGQNEESGFNAVELMNVWTDNMENNQINLKMKMDTLVVAMCRCAEVLKENRTQELKIRLGMLGTRMYRIWAQLERNSGTSTRNSAAMRCNIQVWRDAGFIQDTLSRQAIGGASNIIIEAPEHDHMHLTRRDEREDEDKGEKPKNTPDVGPEDDTIPE